MKKVLVAGATGYLGRFVVQEFKKQGYWVRALARNAKKLESISEFIDEIFLGKVSDTNSLAEITKGIDIVFQNQLAGKDLNEKEILNLIRGKPTKLILTPIGGQGYLLGRGNQQISPDVISHVGKDNIIVVATPNKINSMEGRPLLVDSGDKQTDHLLGGYYRVITSYRDSIIYRVTH